MDPSLKTPATTARVSKTWLTRDVESIQVDSRHSQVTTATSTPSYQSGGEYGGGYSSRAEHRGHGHLALEVPRTSPGQGQGDHFSRHATPRGTAELTERLTTCHRCSRIVRVLAVLDAVVVLVGASAFTPLILMIWGPIAGFLSSNFEMRAAYTFLFYYGMRISWDIGWLLSGGITWTVVWVFLFADAAASGLVYFYLQLLHRCTTTDIEQLRDPNREWTSPCFSMSASGTQSAGSSVH